MSIYYRRPKRFGPNAIAALISIAAVLGLASISSCKTRAAKDEVVPAQQVSSDAQSDVNDGLEDADDTPLEEQALKPGEDESAIDLLGIRTQALDDPDSIYVVVNKAHGIDIDYEPDDLVEVSTFVACENNRLRKQAAEAFYEMYDKALLDDVRIGFGSGYRPGRYQQQLWEGYRASYGEARACEISAKGGYSEHQTGLCFDATQRANSFDGINYTSEFANTKTGIWLAEHSWEYGFILRYPEGYEDITGYTFEPWHYRYIGKKAAKLYHESDAHTLEEFFHCSGGVEYK